MAGSFRVLTLNIWNRFGPWPERLAAIRDGVRALAPDLIGLQEVLRVPDGDKLDQAARIAEGFGYFTAFGQTNPEYGYGNAILSRWPIVKSATYPLPRGGTDEWRNLLHAEVDAPFGRLHFFTTHLNWKFHEGHVRELQVREVTDRVNAIAPVGGFPAVITGDFNAAPDADEIRFMRGLTSLGGRSVYFADCFDVAGDGTKGATFCRRNTYADMCREPDRRIDYVFVRGPDDRGHGEPLDAKVCMDQATADGIWPSDHFGVIATIST